MALHLTREQHSRAKLALQRLTEREEALVASLREATAAVDALEELKPHGVVRIDPEKPVDDHRIWNVATELQARAEARAKEWIEALGGGAVAASAPATAGVGAQAVDDGQCSCRRDAWVTIVRTARRPVQVVAALLSVLPPCGSGCRLADVSWLEAPAEGGGGGGGDPMGTAALQLLRSLQPTEPYDFGACATRLATLSLPVPCHAHLSAQPLMHGHKARAAAAAPPPQRRRLSAAACRAAPRAASRCRALRTRELASVSVARRREHSRPACTSWAASSCAGPPWESLCPRGMARPPVRQTGPIASTSPMRAL